LARYGFAYEKIDNVGADKACGTSDQQAFHIVVEAFVSNALAFKIRRLAQAPLQRNLSDVRPNPRSTIYYVFLL
jgi:hypothetical protein